jgi:AsmA protein
VEVDMVDAPRSRIGRKIGLAVAIAVGAVVALLVVLVLLVSSGAVTSRVVAMVLPKASAALGRDVTLRHADLKLFPATRVRLEGFSVAGRAGEPALVAAEGLDVQLRLWPLLRSFGKDVEIDAIVLDRPAVTLVRAKDGTWNYEGLGSAGKAPPTPAKPAEQAGPSAKVAVERFAIHDGAVRVIDATRPGGEAGVALQAMDVEARHVGEGLPLTLSFSAALASEKPNLSLQLSVAALPSAVPARAEDWPVVTGKLSVGPLALDRVSPLLPAGTSGVVRGGAARLEAEVSTQGGAYRVDGQGALRDVRLRGQPASGSFRASAAVPPADPAAGRLEIADLKLKGPGVDLGGNAVVEARPIRARFAFDGPLLDLDALMGALPPSQPAAKEAAAKPKEAAGEPLPPAMREEIADATASGSLALGELRSGKLRATQVRARVTLRGGVLTIQEGSAGIYGGTLDLAGTKASLAEPEPSWKLAARVTQLDVAEATKTFAGTAPVGGRSDATIDLAGKGIDWPKIRDAVTGSVALQLKDGTLSAADLGGEALSGLSKGLAAAGQGGAAGKVASAGKGTPIRDLAAQFAVKNGWMTLKAPLKFRTPTGGVELTGRIGLDMRLDMTGRIEVPKQALAGIVPATAQLPPTIPVPIAIGGTLTSPAVGVKADEVAAALAKGQAAALKKALQGEGEKAAKQGLGGLLQQFGK